jgi:hypothetical protein
MLQIWHRYFFGSFFPTEDMGDQKISSNKLPHSMQSDRATEILPDKKEIQ